MEKTTTERKASKKSIITPTKDQTKLKSNQGSQRSVTTNRERKGSNDAIQKHNIFGSLSGSSDDMELGQTPDRPRANRSRSRSEHHPTNSSNNRSKSPITYPWYLV